uniref:Uncharacterized protein n=1 Tax=Lotus japonicus TaxID=34305 RepID=I3SZ91_LOTJA|nr:unknown [Lotus japonicus]
MKYYITLIWWFNSISLWLLGFSFQFPPYLHVGSAHATSRIDYHLQKLLSFAFHSMHNCYCRHCYRMHSQRYILCVMFAD